MPKSDFKLLQELFLKIVNFAQIAKYYRNIFCREKAAFFFHGDYIAIYDIWKYRYITDRLRLSYVFRNRTKSDYFV